MIKRKTLLSPTVVFATVLLTILCAFTLKPNVQPGLGTQLIGEWRNLYVRIRLNVHGPNRRVIEADSANWETRLRIKPIRTHFNADDTYYSEYRDLRDSIIRIPSGTWVVKGDSIIITQLKPEKSIMKLKVSINKDKATFSGLLDFDGDGKNDDEYFGIQRRFGP